MGDFLPGKINMQIQISANMFSTSHNYVERIFQKYGIANADLERNTNTLKYRGVRPPTV